MLPGILFNDGRADLAPLTDLRDAADIRTGVLTTRDRWAGLLHLVETPGHDELLAVNDRCVLPPPGLWRMRTGAAMIDEESGEVLAARITGDLLEDLRHGRCPVTDTVGCAEHLLLQNPWHVRTLRDRCIAHDLAAMSNPASPKTPPEGFVQDDRRVNIIGDQTPLIAPDARVYAGATIDCENGQVFIGPGAVVRPGAVIVGPAAVLDGAVVNENAIIRANTVIGPSCKVGGEIGGTIFQGFSNKGHEGYLGDSWVGEWANLGAGTTGSNLLNTYGIVKMTTDPDRDPEPTGETFLGALIGDHAKTAIGTRIMTGAVIMTGAMYAATPPIMRCIPRFAWVTDDRIGVYDLRKFIEVKRTVMARRGQTPSDAYVDRISRLHHATVNA